MAKNSIDDYSTTAGDNTDVGGHNIAEGCPPGGVNDAMRTLMSHLKTEKTSKDAAIAARLEKADAGLLSGFRNKLMNPRMLLRQWPNSIVIAAGSSKIVCDRWIVTNNTNQSCTVAQNDGAVGDIRQKILNIAFSAAPTSGDVHVFQAIEDVASIRPGEWTHTFDIAAFGSMGNTDVSSWWEQQFGSGGSPSTRVAGSTVADGQATSSWSTKRMKHTIPSISGKTMGTTDKIGWFNSIISFAPRGTGSVAITNCAFVAGDTTTEDDPVGRVSLADELARCKRYYRKSYRQSLAAGASCDLHDCVGVASRAGASATGYVEGLVKFDTEMRRAPTIVTFDRNGVSGKAVLAAGGGYVDNSAVTIDRFSDAGFRFFSDNTTTKDGLIFAYTANADYI